MHFLLTLAHIFSSLFPFAFLLAIPVFVLKSFKTPTRTPEKTPSKPDLPETPSKSSTPQGPTTMPSLLYHPSAKFFEGLNQTTPSHVAREPFPMTPQIETVGVKQPYDAFLVLDVEATCFQGTGFEWAHEIIVRLSIRHCPPFLIARQKEWPVCLLRWKDKSAKGKASQLEVVGEFRSFVKPTWRPQLSQFCTDLTGITQVRFFFFVFLVLS